MEAILTISFILYNIRVIACICALAAMDKWELENNGITTKQKAVLFAFMPLYLFYLIGKNINKKFEK
tara:strand:+ start:280 stop:480 length:201 start_codon:yes stop_codon:yes gene_type:complete